MHWALELLWTIQRVAVHQWPVWRIFHLQYNMFINFNSRVPVVMSIYPRWSLYPPPPYTHTNTFPAVDFLCPHNTSTTPVNYAHEWSSRFCLLICMKQTVYVAFLSYASVLASHDCLPTNLPLWPFHLYFVKFQDNLKLMDDLAALRPTIFASVPRLYNRIYTA
jgi:hypothetical protein